MSKCILEKITESTPTEFWNDTCDVKTLRRAVSWGATGATSNPVIVLGCVKADPDRWGQEISAIRRRDKTFSEIEIAWELIRQLAQEAMPVLEPAFRRSGGRQGRLAIQVNPKYFTNPDRMIEHATEIASWGDNLTIKVPAVEAGFVAMEELVAQGISVLSTVQFTLPQAIATAEAFERGYRRAQANNRDTSGISSWAAIMVGRLDDHLRDEQKKKKIPVNSEDIHHASLAVFKKVAQVFKQRGYRTKAMAAAIRGSYHCMNFVGGEVVVTLPPGWQDFVNAADEPIEPKAIEQPEPQAKIDKLRKHFPDFHRAYEEDGMKVSEFVGFGSTRNTLRQFIGGYEDLLRFVRDHLL